MQELCKSLIRCRELVQESESRGLWTLRGSADLARYSDANHPSWRAIEDMVQNESQVYETSAIEAGQVMILLMEALLGQVETLAGERSRASLDLNDAISGMVSWRAREELRFAENEELQRKTEKLQEELQQEKAEVQRLTQLLAENKLRDSRGSKEDAMFEQLVSRSSTKAIAFQSAQTREEEAKEENFDTDTSIMEAVGKRLKRIEKACNEFL